MKNFLADKRKDAKLTQLQVAQQVGIQENAYQRYERNKVVPSVDIALRIARALGTTVEELFVLEDEE